MQTTDTQSKEDSSRRNRSIKSAVFTSLASKLGTVLLQFVSIPIAYQKLGPETFGLYATISIAIGTVIVFQLGIGPALAHGLSHATSKKDLAKEKDYFSTSWLLMVALTLIGGAVAGLVFNFVPLHVFLGDEYTPFEEQIMPGLWLGLAIVLFEFVLSHTERSREGYLQVHLNNLWGAAGNFLGALAVVAAMLSRPSIETLILAVYGSRVLARIGNTIHLYLQRPELRPSIRHFKVPLMKELLSDGFSFTISHTITGLVQLNVCGLIVARHGGPPEVGIFQILMNFYVQLLGIIMMFTTPTWPAIVDAWARADTGWIRRATKRLWALTLGYAGCGVVGLTFLGPLILPLVFGDEFPINRDILFAFSLYFLGASWGHTNHSILVGLGLVRRSATISIIETAILPVLAFFGIAWFSLPGLFEGMALAMFAVSAWIFPLMLLRRVKEKDSVADETLAAPLPLVPSLSATSALTPDGESEIAPPSTPKP
ncbi:MAG: lipopolysaccharide biosynthesis protein [Verrucomicrobiota bacterium JB023]|nr:lipopolysaccharide biosynthesis protein [Verrucomicrobiota bacterium JB023]